MYVQKNRGKARNEIRQRCCSEHKVSHVTAARRCSKRLQKRFRQKQEKDALLLLRRQKNLYKLQSRRHHQRTMAAADHTHRNTSYNLPVRMCMHEGLMLLRPLASRKKYTTRAAVCISRVVRSNLAVSIHRSWFPVSTTMDDWKLLEHQQPPPGFEWLARQSTFLFLSLSSGKE